MISYCKRLAYGLAVLLAMTAVCHAELSAEVHTAFQRYVALSEALLPVLERVTDQASADAAAPELEKLLPAVYVTRRELGAISQLSEQDAAELRARYEKNMRVGWGKVYEQLFRLQRVRSYDSVPFFKQFSTLCSLLDQ